MPAATLIIGSSVSGQNLALALRAKDKTMPITLITDQPYFYYDARLLPDFLKDSHKEKDLLALGQDYYQQENINFIKEKQAVSVNFKKKTVICKDKTILDYQKLVIACGLKIVLPEIPGARKEGVFSLYTLDDYKKLSQYFISDQVCVVGANHDTLKLASALVERYKVDVKVISQKPFDAIGYPPQVEVLADTIQEIIGEGQVQAVKFSSGKIIASSAVIFTDEFKGNAGFLENTSLELKSTFIVVDDESRTNVENVFAVGAVCTHRDNAHVLKSWDECLEQATRLSEIICKDMNPVINQA